MATGHVTATAGAAGRALLRTATSIQREGFRRAMPRARVSNHHHGIATRLVPADAPHRFGPQQLRQHLAYERFTRVGDCRFGHATEGA